MAKLYFRYSAMNAGKSTSLVQVAFNYEERGMGVRIYTTAIDDRFEPGYVTSRLGVRRPALPFDAGTEFFTDTKTHERVACILIDEAQFLTPEQVRELHRVAHVLDIPVIAFGIRSDFRGEPFPGSAYLLALADDIEEIKNICACGRKATMNVRVDEQGRRITQGEQIGIEGQHRYLQMCGSCFYNAETDR